ncbi:hypothetical protein MIMGU_mgv1a020622mg, partial [Erythranthe guttata]
NLIQGMAYCFFTDEYTVRIYSDETLGDYTPLTVQCASGKEDLGRRSIDRHQGQKIYQWKFCENFIGKSIYYCHFWWMGKSKRFEVFNSDFAKRKCTSGTCLWIVRNDGFYIDNELFRKSDKWYTW